MADTAVLFPTENDCALVPATFEPAARLYPPHPSIVLIVPEWECVMLGSPAAKVLMEVPPQNVLPI